MDANPKTIAYKLAKDNWPGWETGADTYHQILVVTPTPTPSPTPTTAPPPTPPGTPLPTPSPFDLSKLKYLESIISMGADTQGNVYVYGEACIGGDGYSTCNEHPGGASRYWGLWIFDTMTGEPVVFPSFVQTTDTSSGQMVAGSMGDLIFSNMNNTDPYEVLGTPFYTAWGNAEFLDFLSDGSFDSYNVWYDRNPNVMHEETLSYNNLWADYSGNVYGIGTDAKNQRVYMENGNISPTTNKISCVYAADIDGINHVLSEDGNLYTLDASGQTTNAYATQLPLADIPSDNMLITPDGRALILDPTAGVLYQYTLNGTLLANDSIGDSTFKPSVIGTRPDGSIILVDNKAQMRLYPQVPLPTGFTPVATPTTTNSFTPTPTFTLTITPSPTVTLTYTPTGSATPTVTLTPSYTWTPTITNTFTPTGSYTSTFTPTDTPPYSWNPDPNAVWMQATADGGFLPRTNPGLAVYNGLIWMIGGENNDIGPLDEVWNSPDGATWSKVLAYSASGSVSQFSPRAYFASAVYDNLMWVVGGIGTGGDLNDAWYSSDGVHWTQAASRAAFTARNNLSSVVFNNELMILGGWDPTNFNDVWETP
jgi:hypothetical protein